MCAFRFASLAILSVTLMSSSAPAGEERRDVHGDLLPEGALVRLGSARLRHPGMIFSLAFSPNGKVLAASDIISNPSSARRKGSIRLWDVATGNAIRTLVEYDGGIRCLCFSADGAIVASASASGEPVIRLTEVATGKKRPPINAGGPVRFVSFSPDGKTLASCGARRQVTLWDVSTGDKLRSCEGVDGEGECVAFSPDGKTLASGHNHNQGVCLWDVATGRQLHHMPLPKTAVWSVAFSADGKTLVSAVADGTIRLWDPAAGKELNAMRVEGGPHQVCFTPDGAKLYVTSTRGTTILDRKTGKTLTTLSGKGELSYALGCSPDGKVIAWSEGSSLRLADLATGKDRFPPVGMTHPVQAVAWSNDGKRVATAGTLLQVWEAATGKENPKVRGFLATCASFAPDDKTLLVGFDQHQMVRILDLEEKKVHEPIEVNPGEVRFLRILADGKTVVSLSRYRKSWVMSNVRAWSPNTLHAYATIVLQTQPLIAAADSSYFLRTTSRHTAEKGVRVWNLRTGKELRLVGDSMAEQIALTPDGRLLALGMDNVHVWDFEAGKKVQELAQRTKVLALALTPDGRRVVHSTFQHGAGVWELASGGEAGQFQGHEGNVVSLAVSPDGRVVATGGTDLTVRLWDLETLKELKQFRGHQGTVLTLAFSPDGQQLLSGSADATALIWDVSGVLPAEVKRAERLTPEERARLWSDLALADGKRSYQAARRLARDGGIVPFLRERIGTEPSIDAKRIARLIADLDSNQFKIRDSATAELASLGKFAEPALEEALKGTPSPEVRDRIERILKNLSVSKTSPGVLQALRAIEVLELRGDAEAQKVLEAFTRPELDAWVVQEAKTALRLLERTTRKL